jgi:hypothetical protein
MSFVQYFTCRCSTSKDFINWEYKKVVINEPFHLSYPFIFENEGNFYLIPESHRNLSVRLYKAIRFPDKWEYISNILYGYHYTDPVIFFMHNKFWLIVSNPYSDSMYIFFSNKITGKWTPHPLNPVIALDKHRARNGGRVFGYKGKMFRIAQDCSPYYGIQTFAYEISHISTTEYKEVLYSTKPITRFSGKGWNAVGMHHVDLQYINNKWYACVDGRGNK